MERFTLSLRRFRQLAVLTTAAICLLVIAGGVVRLTGSGLGCDDWPNCNETRFIDVSSGHAAIEQVNRIFSGLIGIPVLALAIGSFRVRPPRRDLRWPSVGVLVSVLANGVVGGIAVRGDLHPALVQSHFLLAMISIGFGTVAVVRASEGGRPRASASATVRRLVGAIGAGTATALVTGTVVTGTGPHAGDEGVRRFGFDIADVARVDSVAVLATVGATLVLVATLRHDPPARSALDSIISAWLFVAIVQGLIGYLQYFNGVPELLVGAHLAGATGLWVVTVVLLLRVLEPGSIGGTESTEFGKTDARMTTGVAPSA